MRFELDPMLAEVREQVRAFAAERILRLDPSSLAEGRPIETLWGELTEMGLPLLTVPESRGGAGLPPLALALVAEELGRADASLAVALALHLAVAEAVASSSPPSEQPLGMALEGIASAQGLPLAPGWASRWVIPVAGGWRWIEPGLVPSEAVEGPLLGLRGLAIRHASIGPEAASAPPAAPVRPLHALLGLAAAALGAGEAALALALDYARDRQQFGRPIARFQAVRFMLADARTQLDAARWTLWRAAQEPLEAARVHAARRLCVRAAALASDHALQVHGGMGYVREVPVERHLRDAIACGAWLGGLVQDAAEVAVAHLGHLG